MEFVFRLAFYFLLASPILMGILYGSKKITLKQVFLMTITFVSIFFEILYLYLATLDQPSKNVFMLPHDEWITSVALSVFLWLFLFLVTRPFHKN